MPNSLMAYVRIAIKHYMETGACILKRLPANMPEKRWIYCTGNSGERSALSVQYRISNNDVAPFLRLL
jgi:hypothetical protein